MSCARPDILLVAFGNPKQEKWLSMHRDRLKVPVSIGIGGSLDMIAGKLTRAPRWMQKTRHGVVLPRRPGTPAAIGPVYQRRLHARPLPAAADGSDRFAAKNEWPLQGFQHPGWGHCGDLPSRAISTGRLLAEFERYTRMPASRECTLC